MSSFHIGARIRTTQGFTTVPKGSHGVIDRQDSHPGDWHVTMDDGQNGFLHEDQMEVFTPVFGGHYQPVVGVPDPVPVLDADAALMETNVTAATTEPEPVEVDYLAITRNFCR